VSREEIAKAEDMGDYYRVPADNRDLNYDKFILDGQPEVNQAQDYTSHNTQRLDVEGVKKLLLSLDYVQQELKNS
jgi:UDP-glucose 4-epimerase